MKNAFVRMLVLATLATSVSAFAATGDSPSNNVAGASSNQQNGCPTSQENKKQKKEKKQHEETQQEKDFDRLLMGSFG